VTLHLLDPRADDARPAEPAAAGRVPYLPALLLGIVLLGALLRFVGLNWDGGHHLHPDERFLTMVENAIQLPSDPFQYFDSATSPLNPYNRGFGSFVYGTVPLFLVRVIAELGGWNTYDKVHLLGRVLSGLFDLGTILVLFCIGRRLFNARVGLLAAFLVTVTPMHIQQAHFFTMDSFLVFFLTVAFYYAVRVAQQGGTGNYALLGLFYGLATASKINAATFGLVVLVACAVRAWHLVCGQAGPPGPRGLAAWRRAEEPLAGFVLALVLAFVAFRLGQPYAFTGPAPWNVGLAPKFLADLDSWRKIGSGAIDYPPSIQWTNRTAYLYPFEQLVRWGMGVPLGLVSWAGVALATVALLRRPRRYLVLVLPLVWIAFNWWYWGGAFLKPMRYFLVIYPELILLGAWLLLALLAWARSPAAAAALSRRAHLRAWAARLPGRQPPAAWGRYAALGLLVVVAGWTTLYALAYSTIYLRPTTRVAASEYLYAHYLPGTRVANEHWDDPVPLNLDGRPSAPYAGPQLELYAEDEPAKREKLLAALDQADIIAITSNRLYKSIPRIPERWPLAIEYYRLLFSGELGFERVATFASYPQLGPLVFVDEDAEELWTVYDHPTVMLFRKTPQYSSQRARALLEAVPLDHVIKGLKPVHAHTHGLLMTPELRAAQTAGGTWSDIIQRDNLFNQVPALSWWLLAVLLGWAAYPLCWRVFGRLGDRGYGIAKTLAIALLAWGAWLLASLRWLPYSRGSIVLVLALLVGASALVVWRHRAAFMADLRDRWQVLAFAEVVFAAGYVFFHGIRLANPDLWHGNFGGEKPMDFAYLNAVLKSTYFPPYDPWLAGGYINYYYFGQVLVATLIKLTGTVPAVAYNLAIALFFGLLVSGAYSFAFNWLLGRQGAAGRAARRLPALGWAELGGLLAALFVGIIGNLDGLVQLFENLGKASGATGSTTPVLGGLARALAGLGPALSGAYHMPPFDFWRSTRVIGPEDPGPITEFPYFTFLYGDLHAHLLALPLTLLALHVALALARGGGLAPLWAVLTGWRPGATRAWLGKALGQESVWLVAVGGLVLGLLRATNTWDYPTYLLLLVGAGAVAEYRAARGITLGAVVRAGVLAAALFVVANLVIQPYLSSFALFYTGVEPIKAQTSLIHYLTILGFFLFAVVSLVVYETWGLRRRVAPLLAAATLAPQAGPAQGFWSPPSANGWLNRGTLAASGLLAGLLVAAGLAVAGKVVPAVVALLLVGVAWLVPWHRQAPDRLVLLGMIAGALVLTALVEFVTLKGDIGRMNTVFKFYLQVWVLLALAAAIVGVRLLRRWRPTGPWRAWAAAAAVLLAGCLIYPVQATPVKLGYRFEKLPPTDDGMAFMQTAVYHDRDRAIPLVYDYRAIRWLQDHVPGSPVILEANTGLYKWGSRVSIHTGLPTVVGWDWHQRQQRGDFGWMVEERLRDVAQMYDSPDPNALLPLLRKYRVEYIYVGPLERAYYSAAGLDKFRGLVGSVLDLVYLDPPPVEGVADFTQGVQIYRVRPEALGLAPAAPTSNR
jgi:YYY domain-containing protein